MLSADGRSVREADVADLPDALALLAAAGLPTAGVAEQFPAGYFVVRAPESGALVAMVGLESRPPYWLLRSLVVSDCARGRRWGSVLVRIVVHLADIGGVRALFLRTNTAEEFFRHLGFRPIPRHEVPAALRPAEEPRDAGPADTVVMRLPLSTFGYPDDRVEE